MKIELKKFKHFPSLSEETYCFTADLIIDGVKCGYAKNNGYGGNTDVRSDHSPKGMKLIEVAENYCKSLPPYYVGKLCTIDMNLENFIDDLVDKLVKDKARAMDEKRLNKKMEKMVLYGNDEEYYTLKFSIPLTEILTKYPQSLKKHILEFTKKHEGKGYRILNKNIPEYIYN